MAKTPPNSGKAWTPGQDAQLKEEAAGDTPTPVIALHLGRSEDAVRSRASDSTPLHGASVVRIRDGVI